MMINIGCFGLTIFGLTEPNHGSDAGAMETRAIYSDKKVYKLNGSKTWLVLSTVSFTIERKSQTVSVVYSKEKFSLRTSVTGMILMDNVIVPEENLLNVQGLKVSLSNKLEGLTLYIIHP
ncbi:putative glutaryl-CoA dehydrogenase, mitochondrial [Trachymyrmex cornetzi]|uniref:Putative glutaryl-CoA dehydrogenase, mitochondrial n=1 Tax=Trachymyrmex cornetzi TaxID=471704 RepID=A0A151JPS9_9HYME|nr:putative glutaryl-CoA dehydrogenase, mitochondrial [Trachymyrmex cornetzi]